MSYVAPFFVAFALAVLSASATSPPVTTELVAPSVLPPVALPTSSASTAVGAVGGSLTQSEGAHETHNDKDLSIKLGSKQGSSSSFKNTHGQAAAHGAQAHVEQPYGYYPHYPLPHYPQYPVYPPYPGWGYGY